MAITVDRDGIPTNRPVVKLRPGEHYVCAVLGSCRRSAMKEGWTTVQWATVRDLITRCKSYEQALAIAKTYFEVS
jgi:hypothetical protein